MLKTIRLFDKLAPSKNNDSKSAFSKNNNNKPAFRKNNGNSKIDRFDLSRNDIKHTKKSGKLSKLRKLKSKKTFKSWNLTKLGKKLSKSGNLTNFDIIKAKPKFLSPNTKTTFNRLWLTFI